MLKPLICGLVGIFAIDYWLLVSTLEMIKTPEIDARIVDIALQVCYFVSGISSLQQEDVYRPEDPAIKSRIHSHYPVFCASE